MNKINLKRLIDETIRSYINEFKSNELNSNVEFNKIKTILMSS